MLKLILDSEFVVNFFRGENNINKFLNVKLFILVNVIIVLKG